MYIFKEPMKHNTKIDYIPKKKLNKFKRIEIIYDVCSVYNELKLGTKSRKITGRSTNTWKPNNTFLNYLSVKQNFLGATTKYIQLNER